MTRTSMAVPVLVFTAVAVSLGCLFPLAMVIFGLVEGEAALPLLLILPLCFMTFATYRQWVLVSRVRSLLRTKRGQQHSSL